MTNSSSPIVSNWRTPVWLALLVAAGVAFTLGFACAMPFAAFATIAALTLSRKDAFALLGGLWLANQLVGFLLLGYPHTSYAYSWSAGLLVTALLTALVALAAAQNISGSAITRVAAILAASFITYEAALFVGSLLLGGTENFTVDIQSRVLIINAGALAGLFALNALGEAVGFAAAPQLRRSAA